MASYFEKNGWAVVKIFVGAALSIFGYFLLVRSLRRQRDPRKKLFLQILGVYLLLNFLAMLRIGHLLELRYFLMLQFVPLVLIGLMADYLEAKVSRQNQTGAVLRDPGSSAP